MFRIPGDLFTAPLEPPPPVRVVNQIPVIVDAVIDPVPVVVSAIPLPPDAATETSLATVAATTAATVAATTAGLATVASTAAANSALLLTATNTVASTAAANSALLLTATNTVASVAAANAASTAALLAAAATEVTLASVLVVVSAPPPVSVSNFPATQPISGTVGVSNFPATQSVSGSISILNFPATQPVSGTISVSNFPATISNIPVQYAGKTIQRFVLSQVGAPGTTLIAAASPGNKHKVIGAFLTISATGTVKFMDTANLTGAMNLITGTPFIIPTDAIFPWVETLTNRALNIVTTVGGANGVIFYLTEP